MQAAFGDEQALPNDTRKIVRKRQEEHNIEKELEAILGYASSLSSWISDAEADPDADLSMFLHWLAMNGQAYLDRKSAISAQKFSVI